MEHRCVWETSYWLCYHIHFSYFPWQKFVWGYELLCISCTLCMVGLFVVFSQIVLLAPWSALIDQLTVFYLWFSAELVHVHGFFFSKLFYYIFQLFHFPCYQITINAISILFALWSSHLHYICTFHYPILDGILR